MTENNQLGGEGRVRKYDFTGTIPATSNANWYSQSFGYGSGIFLNDADVDGIIRPDLRRMVAAREDRPGRWHRV